MFCPKCDKFVPSSARRCPNCGAGFDLGADDTESYSDALPRAADDSDLYDDIPEEDAADAPQEVESSSGIGTKLKSLFGFGRK